ncbi:MAG: long-chain-fatty-acid--CoA ligase [Deltaproteobacteria bacterium]|nr:long-chain-fatty-acid--CoA ligase [Deltaproteobacteria bacterium]
MTEKFSYPEYTKHYPLLVRNVMRRPLYNYPDDIAMVYRNDAGQYYRLTWRQWHERTCQLAHALKVLDVKEGDRIATMALNHHWHMENIYATICSGAISHPINIRLSLEHMIYTINHAEDKIIFFDNDIKPLVEALYDRIKDTVKAFVYMSEKPGLPETKIAPLYEYEELIKDQPKQYDWPDLDEDTHAVLYYTTGTTGLPKGALYTNRQVYLHCIHGVATSGLMARLPDDPPKPNQNIPMMNVPLFHIHAWGTPFQYVYSASKIIFPGKFTPESFCELVQNEKVNMTAMVPTMLAMIVEYGDIDKWDLSSLTNISIGGGALPLGLKRKAEKLFPQMRAGSGYGMTETLAGVIGASIRREMVDWPKEKIDQTLVKTGLAGVPAIEARVIDEKANDVPHDNETMGEIVLRGHWIMEQYFKDPERTAQMWRDGWFHTGDMAKIDEEGYIIIADRITDVIRSGSEMVPTVLLENLTGNAEFVLEATYVGVPDEKWGEIPMALVKKLPDARETEEDILKFLQVHGVDAGKITKWMLPVYVAFVDEIPKTSVGKFDKIAVRKRIDEFKAKAKRVRLT